MSMEIGLSLGNIVGGLIGTLLIGLIGWFLEQEIGIKHFFKKVYAKISNSSAEMKVNYNLETNMPFEDFKQKAKTDFSDEFDEVSVTTSSERKMRLDINQKFEISIRREKSDMCSLSTNKMVTTARYVEEDFKDLNSAIEEVIKLDKETSQETRHFVSLNDVSCYVYIGTASSVFNIYRSSSLELESYEFDLVDNEEDFTIKATEGHYQIFAESSSGVKAGISEII